MILSYSLSINIHFLCAEWNKWPQYWEKRIGYQISFLLQSNGIFDIYQKRTHWNNILCKVVVISILLNRVLQTLYSLKSFFKIWDMLRSIHWIMLNGNYNLAEMSSTKRISLLMQINWKTKNNFHIKPINMRPSIIWLWHTNHATNIVSCRSLNVQSRSRNTSVECSPFSLSCKSKLNHDIVIYVFNGG